MASNNTTNVTFDQKGYLENFLGPSRAQGLPETILLTTIYCIILITGIIGNVCTGIVIFRNHYMRTATNYYLFSLAISDVLTLILGLPPEMYTIWQAYPWIFGEPFCVFKTFLSEMTSLASVFTITAFTAERYIAICHPIRAQIMSSLSRAVKIIICIWILACAFALPYPIRTRTFYYLDHPITKQHIEDSLMCNIVPEWLPMMKYWFLVSGFMFVGPMIVISVLYVLIGITLDLRKSSIARRTSSPSGTSQARKSVLKMLVAVVIAFFICWAPFHAQRLMTAFIKDDDWTPTLINIQNVLFYISGVLYFVSSTVNPILYNLMSKKYRKAFKDTLCKCCLSKEQRNMRDYRGRPIPSGTTAYVTVNVSNSCNSRTHAGHDGTHIQRSPAIRRALNHQRETSRPNGAPKTKLNSIKIKLFPDSIKKTTLVPTANSADLMGTSDKSKLRTPNGSIASDTSHSPSGSPRSTHVKHLKEEMEMNAIEEKGLNEKTQASRLKVDIISIDNRHNAGEDTML